MTELTSSCGNMVIDGTLCVSGVEEQTFCPRTECRMRSKKGGTCCVVSICPMGQLSVHFYLFLCPWD